MTLKDIVKIIILNTKVHLWVIFKSKEPIAMKLYAFLTSFVSLPLFIGVLVLWGWIAAIILFFAAFAYNIWYLSRQNE